MCAPSPQRSELFCSVQHLASGWLGSQREGHMRRGGPASRPGHRCPGRRVLPCPCSVVTGRRRLPFRLPDSARCVPDACCVETPVKETRPHPQGAYLKEAMRQTDGQTRARTRAERTGEEGQVAVTAEQIPAWHRAHSTSCSGVLDQRLPLGWESETQPPQEEMRGPTGPLPSLAALEAE